MTWFKKYWWVLVIIAALAIGAYFWFRKPKDIAFDFTLGGDLNNLLSGLNTSNQKGFGLYLNVPMTTMITNNSLLGKTLKNIMGSISYGGETILQTQANSANLKDVPVNAKSSATITDDMQVLINSASIKFFTELVNGKKPKVNYDFGATVGGKPYSISNSTIINKTA